MKLFRLHYYPGVDTASNRNEYQEYLLGVKRTVRKDDKITTILCLCHDIWEYSEPIQACNRIDLTFILYLLFSECVYALIN